MDEAKSLDHTLTLALVLRHSSIFEAMIGNHSAAQRLASALRTICVERDVHQWRHLGELMYLWASLGAGERVGLDGIFDAFERQRQTGFLLNMPFNLMLVADACFAAGDPERSDGLLRQALALAETTGEVWVRPELLRRRACRAVLCAAVSKEDAERWLSEALGEARRQGDRVAELRINYDLARLWIEREDCQAARDLLAPLCDWLDGRADLPDLVKAKALLDQAA
ncbi:hypothetical protein [Azospirillum canadense]|uniref:hypothetical protein n=1 Tax=Azospirillum canadense TaxID=403962 RepID=UPI002226CB9A|nr:hypothetical protein [Azospirillum canadense]MCW2239354.1 hypothetical protein [Azospirillum canadense]